MPDQVNSTDALAKALLSSALYSVLLSPISVQPPSAWVLQPRVDKKIEYMRAIPSLENPCFDQEGAISILKFKGGTEERRQLKAEFEKLSQAWKGDRRATSLTIEIVMHPAYQQIIALGPPAIPLLLQELQREPDYWFWALRLLAKEDPVPARSRGNMREMRDAWLQWGRTNGHV